MNDTDQRGARDRMGRVELLFGAEERARILEAVQKAEAASRGQIVPVVVGRSDPYPEARFRAGLLFAAIATIAVIAARLPLTLPELPLVQIAAGVLGAVLSLWSPVERLMVGRRAMDEAVRARAERAFFEEGLNRTREGTGVLVFASLFEREAVVLGDHGIHARMGDDWARALAPLVDGLKRGEPTRGFVEAIAVCGTRLAENFPRDPTRASENELDDAFRTRER